MILIFGFYCFMAGVVAEWHSAKIDKEKGQWFRSLLVGLFWPFYTIFKFL